MFLTHSVEFLDTELGKSSAKCCGLSLPVCCDMDMARKGYDPL